MVDPNEVENRAVQLEDENYAFRRFLKIHADPKELDKQFLKLHKELFSSYDCNKCRNCCKKFHGEINVADLEKTAESLGMSQENFKKKYLSELKEGVYPTKNKPCDFLQKDGACLLRDCKPESCKEYPHTDKPDRFESLLNIVESAKICPVVFEMLERLKKEYHFEGAVDNEYKENARTKNNTTQFFGGWSLSAYAEEHVPVVRDEKKIYPNDPCPCGSGKKYKKCCGRNF